MRGLVCCFYLLFFYLFFFVFLLLGSLDVVRELRDILCIHVLAFLGFTTRALRVRESFCQVKIFGILFH